MPSFANDPTLAGMLDPSEMLTIYNLNAAKRSQFGDIVDRNGDNNSTYDGFETSFTARLPTAPTCMAAGRSSGSVSKVLRQQRQPEWQHR